MERGSNPDHVFFTWYAKYTHNQPPCKDDLVATNGNLNLTTHLPPCYFLVAGESAVYLCSRINV